ncbi:DUF4097 family beta strand repeat-containing protein [Candidatus Villigracilis affinis]|uniref:DUF4097 family beta strand repeat-containing protein n=1 Tax=Candidatus Villigracilis affinis TaxID=3140682 RepID=UPI002A1C79AD|nr:DUF4097 family beta strand repeat protein [Anaerolineales bacterium]
MKRPIVITLLVLALLFVLAGIGAVVFFTVNGGFPTNSPFDRNNVSSVVEESKTLKVDADKPLTLTVSDEAGDVTVTGGDVKTVEVKVVKTAYDSTQARADEEVKTIKYVIEQNGNAITIKYEIPDSMNFNNNINTVDFIVTVPTETAVNIDTNFGSVDVQDIQGAVDLTNDFGNITAKNIEGELAIESNSGEINVEAVDAGDKNVEIKTDFGDITLEKIKANDVSVTSNSGVVTFTNVRASGDAYIKTDFGNTVYENGSAASLTLDTNSGKISITKVNITKELNIQNDFGDIELTQAMAGSYDLHTNSGSITVDGAKGKLKAYTDFGNIEITNAKSVTLDIKTNSGNIEFSGSLGAGPHNVKSDFGNIDLALPTDAKLDVDLKTDFGKIRSDLPITVTLTESSSSEEDQIAGSINGGGEQLIASTNSGGINITAIK